MNDFNKTSWRLMNKIIEIKDFNLSIGFSQYWISYKEGEQLVHYPVIISPFNLKKLFEIEGIELTKETDSALDKLPGIYFTKATLLRRNMTIRGDLLGGDQGGDLTAQTCWVKLN